MSRGHRALCFTAFLEAEQTDQDVLIPSEWPDVVYCVWQLELCPETHRLHHQGYVEFSDQKRYDWVHKHCDGLETAHLEPRGGTQDAAIAYCMKKESHVDGPWEFGVRKSQGKRKELDIIRGKLRNGVSEREISDDHFGSWVRYRKSFIEYMRLHNLEVVRNWPMKLIFLIGPSGTGKSWKARHDPEFAGAYWKIPGKWWDGYNGQETVVVDEMYGHRFPFGDLLLLIDRYPFQVETKGAVVQFTSLKIVFTSNQEPEHWYSGEKTHQVSWDKNPLNRRIKQFGTVIYMNEVHPDVADFGFTPNPPPLPLMLPDDEVHDGLLSLASALEPSNGGQDPTYPIFDGMNESRRFSDKFYK